MKRTLIIWKNTTPGIAEAPVGQEFYWLRAVGGDCAQDRTAFLALSDNEKLAQSVALLPTGDWQDRDCDPGSEVDTVDIDAPNAEWKGSVNGPVDVVPIVAGDPASYGLTSTFTY